MLKLIKISKNYKTGDYVQQALKELTIEFNSNEFTAILGQSGSGKTTLLNIIGGLDRYDGGDLIINNESTKNFKDKDWDAYRNNCIGFIFQSYNLITHISVLANVELSLTLSGIGKKEKRQRAKEALEKVGLSEHAHKKPNQLSGGQMQRVAIARALVNNPDIILADEPTGALDSETSVQIMNLIKKIAKEKLVIMVTHNPELADKYADRIIKMKDGEIISDNLKETGKAKENTPVVIKKTAMSFLTALNLSFNNIKTKLIRTLITAFASSIGIIGIALILSLSNGFNIQINQFEKDTLSSLPILIGEQATQLDEDTFNKMNEAENLNKLEEYTDKKEIYIKKAMKDQMFHINKITNEYMEYLKKLDAKYASSISYTYATTLNILTKYNDQYKQVQTGNYIFQVLPKKVNSLEDDLDNYDLLAGKKPEQANEIIINLDNQNGISEEVLLNLGIDNTSKTLSFDAILNKELKLVFNDQYYIKLGNNFVPNPNYENMYSNDQNVTLKIVGIVRGKKDKEILTNQNIIGYKSELVDIVIANNKNSEIVKTQVNSNRNILTNELFTDKSEITKEQFLSYLGYTGIPAMIQIYPKDFTSKEQIISFLDKYNDDKNIEDKIIYNDAAKMISSLSGGIMDGITIVLIAFSAISLIVSSIMIGIITYISVLERTKEIGILRALGARKKDVKRVFNAETFLIGFSSGMIGILVASLLTIPINIIIEAMTGLSNVARLSFEHAIILVVISILLTVIGGSIPAKLASKKDPVEALRTE